MTTHKPGTEYDVIIAGGASLYAFTWPSTPRSNNSKVAQLLALWLVD